MPRLPHSLLLRAYNTSPLLPLVLRGTRDLPSAINELRWLTEHVQASKPRCPPFARKRLLHLCKRRSRAEPLQYILGSQPFGELEIKCRPGVLIPRPETEAYTSHLAELLINGKLDEQLLLAPKGSTLPPQNETERRELRLLDICSGSGCISLLLHSLLSKSGQFPNLKTVGLDISPQAITLANENLALAIRQKHIPSFPSSSQDIHLDQALDTTSLHPQHLKGHNLLQHLSSLKQKAKENCEKLRLSGAAPIHFAQHNIFTPLPPWAVDVDIIISNPPYISRSSFCTSTSRSVRKYEPRLALVPDRHEYGVEASERISGFMVKDKKGESEIFYVQLLKIYQKREAKVLVMEVGDQEQALRVVTLALGEKRVRRGSKVEIWRDWPGMDKQEGKKDEMVIEGRTVPVKGAGSMRAVVLFRAPEVEKKDGGGKNDESGGIEKRESGLGSKKAGRRKVESEESIWVVKKRKDQEKRRSRRQKKKARRRERGADVGDVGEESPI